MAIKKYKSYKARETEYIWTCGIKSKWRSSNAFPRITARFLVFHFCLCSRGFLLFYVLELQLGIIFGKRNIHNAEPFVCKS